jgi:hypothetical protein
MVLLNWAIIPHSNVYVGDKHHIGFVYYSVARGG